MGSIEKAWLKFTHGFVDRLARSWTIIVHSLQLLRAHKILVLFPFLNVIALIGIVYFFAMPAVFNVTVGDAWWALWNPSAALDALYVSSRDVDFNLLRPTVSYVGLGLTYLFLVFTATFVNVAFYAEILNALNGRGVNMMRGLATAGSKVFAILGWSLVTGTVGLAVRAIQNKVGELGNAIAAFGGIAWSTAGIFVIPIIIKERRQLSPLAYVRISINLIKKTWGEHAIAFGVGLIGALGILAMIVLFFAFGPILVRVAGPLIGGLSMLLALVLLVGGYMYAISVIGNIFNCGLYIYATEGVVPAPFDADLFAKSWTVRKRNGGGRGTDGTP